MVLRERTNNNIPQDVRFEWDFLGNNEGIYIFALEGDKKTILYEIKTEE